MLSAAKAEARAIQDVASGKAGEINGEAAAKLKVATDAQGAAQKVSDGISKEIKGLEGQIADTKVTLDKTFFLNIPRKWELEDIIKGYQKEANKASKRLEQANKVVEKAKGGVAKETEASNKAKEQADKILSDAAGASGKITGAAEKKAAGITAEASKKAAEVSKAAASKAAGLTKQADASDKQADTLSSQ